MRTPAAAEWTGEEKQTLTTLWAEGKSAREIGHIMGRSRCAVCGMARRINLPRRAIGRAPGAKDLAPRRAKGTVSPKLSSWERKRLLPESLPGDMTRLKGNAWTALPGTEPVALVDIEAGMCRWPIGEERPYRFCGAACGDSTYCVTHSRMATGEGSSMERAAIKFAVDANKAEWKAGLKAQERKWESV